MSKVPAPEYEGTLRKFMLMVPEEIERCSGIKIFGKLIKSIVFTTDVSTIRNVNADAAIAVYPYTPQPIINQALSLIHILLLQRPASRGGGYHEIQHDV